MTTRVLILNGPNLNMLGLLQPEFYGAETLSDVEISCQKRCNSFGFTQDFCHSNHEGELVTWIQETRTKHDAIIINASAYTHTHPLPLWMLYYFVEIQLLSSIFQTFVNAKYSDTIHIFRMLPSVLLLVLERLDMKWLLKLLLKK